MLAQLRERGLPLELIEHLRKAPEILDPGEDPDPYGMMKDISVPSDDTQGWISPKKCLVPPQPVRLRWSNRKAIITGRMLESLSTVTPLSLKIRSKHFVGPSDPQCCGIRSFIA
jgi:hypothetical protein